MLRSRRTRVAMVTAAMLVLGTVSAQAAPAPMSVALQTDEQSEWDELIANKPSLEELDGARDEIDQINDDIEAAEAELEQIQARIEQIQAQVAEAETALTDAEDVLWQAVDAAEAARNDLAAVQKQLDAARQQESGNQERLTRMARDTYMFGPGAADPVMIMIDGLTKSSTNDITKAQHAVDVIMRNRTGTLESSQRLVVTTADLEEQAGLLEEARTDREAEAAAAREAAAQRHADVTDLFAEADQARQRQEELVTELGDSRTKAITTLEQLKEAEAKAKAAAKAKAEAEAEARREAARRAEAAAKAKAAERAAKEAAAARAAAAAERAAEEAAEAAAAASAASSAREQREAMGSVSVVSRGNLSTIGGITVSSSIAGQLEALLNAARADGISLGGSGWRSPETTIHLRQKNGCPDIYTSPASSCRVPTARPGTSMHEKGLAIDFQYNGRTICFPSPPSRCYGNAGFDWLSANASRFGFHGLSSEAWHFSTNGT